MRKCLALISVCLLLAVAQTASAQTFCPQNDGEKMHYNVFIELPKMYVSGICIMAKDSDALNGSIFNEFGISFLEFTYHIQKQKAELHSVMDMMDKWYIRKVLKDDIVHVVQGLQNCDTVYVDNKYNIKYTFSPMKADDNNKPTDNDTSE